MSNKESTKWSDIWIKPSFDSMNIQSKQTKQKSRKRQLNEDFTQELSEDCVQSIDNKFNNNSIGFLDSMVAEDSNQLAFSRYKCNQLCDWFRKQFVDNTSDSLLLLLNGPTGAGKTTSLRVLAKEFNVEVIEYKTYSQYFETVLDNDFNERHENPINSLNQIQNFNQFIADCVRYRTRLGIELTDGTVDSTQPQSPLNRRLVLVEEFPNVFYTKPEALHKELRSLAKRFGNRLIPIVFIISETINGHSEEYKLLPKALQLELNIKTISFTSISNTSLNKILQRLSENRFSKEEIQRLIDSSSGDIRSAINNMQLLYMHSIDTSADKSTKKVRKTKSDKDLNYLLRDPSLTIAHAVGKVLYAKRVDIESHSSVSNQSDLELMYQMPDHLSAYERNPLQDTPEEIADKIVVSSDVFNAWLHQNYIEFCDSIETADKCMDWLRESDALFGFNDFNDKQVFESYQCSLAMRGLMFNISKTNRHSVITESEDNPKPKRTFKPFERPEVFAVNRLKDSLKRQIRETFNEKTLFASTCSLVTDFMPFISQMPKHLHSFDAKYRYLLDKIVNFGKNRDQMDDELSYVLNKSSVNSNETKSKAKVIEMDNNFDLKYDYNIEEIDSD